MLDKALKTNSENLDGVLFVYALTKTNIAGIKKEDKKTLIDQLLFLFGHYGHFVSKV